MIDKEKTPIVNASDNMVKESIEKVYETAVVTTVQVEEAASLMSSMIEESRSVQTMDLSPGQACTLPTLETSADNIAAFGQIKSLVNNIPMTNHAQNYATAQEKSTDVVEKIVRGVF